mmetsp:Transcript_73180/g.223867  ORF Transcript_73180/g.223867 Transcript_73180/m.223867 type:complete len:213 (-) Transcript_73180:82-720(-)
MVAGWSENRAHPDAHRRLPSVRGHRYHRSSQHRLRFAGRRFGRLLLTNRCWWWLARDEGLPQWQPREGRVHDARTHGAAVRPHIRRLCGLADRPGGAKHHRGLHHRLRHHAALGESAGQAGRRHGRDERRVLASPAGRRGALGLREADRLRGWRRGGNRHDFQRPHRRPAVHARGGDGDVVAAGNHLESHMLHGHRVLGQQGDARAVREERD